MTRLRRLLLACAPLLLAAIGSGCDPCAGVSACMGPPRLSVEGRLVDKESGRPLAGARVDVIRVEGVGLEPDSVATIANSEGFFRVTSAASGEGEVALDVVVTPPAGHPHPKYRVRDLRFNTTSVRGDGQVLGLWTTDPYFAYVTELVYRSNIHLPVANALVEFRRTGGVELRGSGWRDGVYSGVTDAAGRLALFAQDVRPVEVGEVVGDLTVYAPAGLPPTVIRELRLRATPAFRPATSPVRAGVGPHLPYYGLVRVGLFPAPDVEVEARRTGGIITEPASLLMRTDRDGIFFLHRFVPREIGDLVIDLIFRPPAPWRSFVLQGIKLPTVEEDSFGRSIGIWDLFEVASPSATAMPAIEMPGSRSP